MAIGKAFSNPQTKEAKMPRGVYKRKKKGKCQCAKVLTTYLITHDNGDERRITVPSNWKVTFGPAAKGIRAGTGSNYKIPLALRFYEAETKQRAIFTDVVSFRDLNIPIQIKKKSVQEKSGFMECDGQRKATTFQATTEEWVNPDADAPNYDLLPNPAEVDEFDVGFTGTGGDPV